MTQSDAAIEWHAILPTDYDIGRRRWVGRADGWEAVIHASNGDFELTVYPEDRRVERNAPPRQVASFGRHPSLGEAQSAAETYLSKHAREATRTSAADEGDRLNGDDAAPSRSSPAGPGRR